MLIWAIPSTAEKVSTSHPYRGQKNNYYDRLRDLGCNIHSIVGNHTAYYKNTNDVNAIDLLLAEYDNIKTYSEATEIKLDNLGVLFNTVGLILRMKSKL